MFLARLYNFVLFQTVTTYFSMIFNVFIMCSFIDSEKWQYEANLSIILIRWRFIRGRLQLSSTGFIIFYVRLTLLHFYKYNFLTPHTDYILYYIKLKSSQNLRCNFIKIMNFTGKQDFFLMYEKLYYFARLTIIFSYVTFFSVNISSF